MEHKQQVMTLSEASKYLKVHISTLYQLAQQGKIPVSKIGRLWRFRKERIDAWLDKQENNRPGPKALAKLRRVSNG